MPDGGTDPTLALRLGLTRNGYTPVPIVGPDVPGKGAGKRPGVDGWQKLDAATLTRPRTLAGMRAKARAALAEGPGKPNTPGDIWAWDLVRDLLRLTGGAH